MAKKSKKNVKECCPCKLNVKALAVASGGVLGLGFLLMGWIAGAGYGVELVNMFSSVYIGYKPGFLGGIIGGVYSLIDGAIAGALIAWVYNKVNK